MAQAKASILSIFKNKNYVRLYLALVTSQIGSIIGLTAFMFYLLNRFSNQPSYATITEMMYSLPTLFLFFIVGVLADRMDRQKIAAYSNWISASLTIVLLFVIKIGWMPLIFALLFIRSGINKFFFPAESGLVQGILKDEQYTTAAGLNQMTNSIFTIFGTGLGATAYWYLGLTGALIIDAIGFILSGLLIRFCTFPTEVRLPNGPSKWSDLKVKSVFQDFSIGLKYILNYPLLLSLIVGFFLFGIVNGGLSVMPIFILKYKLAPDTYEEVMIILSIMFGVGLLVGSVIASIIAQKMKLYQMIILGIAMSGITVFAASIPTKLSVFLPLIFLFALSLPIVNVAIGGWLPKIVERKMMGRVQGCISPLMMLSQTVTLGLIAIGFPKYVAVEMLFYVVGGCMILAAVYYLIVLPKYDKAVETSTDQTLIKGEALTD